jgi:hypothetical protein
MSSPILAAIDRNMLLAAISSSKHWVSGNTEVHGPSDADLTVVILNGLVIASIYNPAQPNLTKVPQLEITDAGYQNTTTRRRLNALLRLCPFKAGIEITNGCWYINTPAHRILVQPGQWYRLPLYPEAFHDNADLSAILCLPKRDPRPGDLVPVPV